MKVLWLINSAFPEIAKAAGLDNSVKEGWISGLFQNIRGKCELVICFPQFNSESLLEGEIKDAKFYGFYKKMDKPYIYDSDVEKSLKHIVDKENPDMVHIAGTEYDHALAMVRAFNKPERTLVTIQGLTSVYERHYMADLPVKVRSGYTFRDLIKRDNLVSDMKHYHQRGQMEEEVIKSVNFIGGRTNWDYACTKRLNHSAEYIHLGEILRASFYDDSVWSYEACEKHSLFVSQGYYPIKGLHFAIEAMADIVKVYPDAKLYVGGGVTLNENSFKSRLKQKNYQRYLAGLLDKYGLRQNVVFLPSLDANSMKERYLKTNVFVSAASIENSPNSLGEAMILGVPCVASMVGGVSEMMTHNEEGYIYQPDAPYMLAHYAMKIFEKCETDKEGMKTMTENARAHAKKSYSPSDNSEALINAYETITGLK